MQRLQAFKFELVPNGEQQRNMRRFAGACRFVYNKALTVQKARREQDEKHLGYAGLCALLVAWKADPDTSWLAHAPSQPLQQALKNLQRAYDNFFAKRADFPCFKKKGRSDSFRYPQGVKLEQANNRIFLPKLGWLRYRNSRAVVGEISNVTVRHACGKWFVSIQTQREVQQPAPTGSAIGIDMGVARFATLSDGTFYAALNSFHRYEAALRRAQQAMSRKTKFSNNWTKAKTKVQRIHSRIGNIWRDFLHKCSTTISKNHAMVVIEDLKVANMSKSARGSSERPGKHVRAKSGLNKAILDQGWFEFRRQLDYKLAWNGAHLIVVSPHNTSRTCPRCAHISPHNRKTQERFACIECGLEQHADHVAAINILSRGMAKLRDEGQDTGEASPGCASTARIACEVSAEVKEPAAGTHRSDSEVAQSRARAP